MGTLLKKLGPVVRAPPPSSAYRSRFQTQYHQGWPKEKNPQKLSPQKKFTNEETQ